MKGHEIFKKSKEVIPGGVNSPVRAFIGIGLDPLIVQRGEGDIIIDVEGRKYIDFCMSWGALLHGHAWHKVVKKACERVRAGSTFGIHTEIEEKFARKIIKAYPSIDQLRFVSSGTEGAMSAVRLARGYTSKPIVIKFNGNYHGHSDTLLVKAGSGVSQVREESSSSGVPYDIIKNTLSLPYNNIEVFQRIIKDPFYSQLISAVIIEPIAANMGVIPATKSFLEVIRKETKKIGAILIFDEVISGFRVNYGGAAQWYGIEPDVVIFGKIIGGGFPAAAFGGKREIMQALSPIGGVYQAGTLSGNPVAMEAGLTTLEEAEQKDFYQTLYIKTKKVTEPIRKALQEKKIHACIREVPGMFTLFWGLKEVSSFEDLKNLDKERFYAYFRFMLENGVYLSPSPYEASFISSAHTLEHLKKTVKLVLEFISRC